MGKGGDLGTQCATSSHLTFGSPALFLIFGSKALDLGILATEKTLVMQLAEVELVADGLELGTNPIPKKGSARNTSDGIPRVRVCGESAGAYASSTSMSSFSVRELRRAAIAS